MSDEAELPQPRLLTTQEAADLLRVTPRTVLNWIDRDRIPYITLPPSRTGQRRKYRISMQGLLDSLSANYDLAQDFGESDVAIQGGPVAEPAKIAVTGPADPQATDAVPQVADPQPQAVEAQPQASESQAIETAPQTSDTAPQMIQAAPQQPA